MSRIKEVNLLETERIPAAGGASAGAFDIRCLWQVAGTVEHWGHIHARTNQYTARFHVEAVDTAYKITSMELQAQERVKFETSLRTMPI
jgi:hypothetical protein